MSDPLSERPQADVPVHLRDDLIAWHRYKKYPYLLAKFAFFGAILYLSYVILMSINSVVFPLFLSLLLAYLLDPMIDKFERKGLSRTVGIMVAIAIVAGAMTVFVAFLYPLIARQVVNVAEKLPTLLDTLQHKTLPWAQARFGFEVPESLSGAVTKYGEELKAAAPSVFKRVGSGLTGVLTQTGVVVASLLNIVMIPIFTFYFLRDFDRMTHAAGRFIPMWRRELILDRLGKIDEVVGAWFRGQVQVGLILSVLYGVGLAVAFWVTGHSAFDGLALGVISGILNIIPYVGFVVGFVMAVLVVLIEWTGWGSLVAVVVVFAVVQGLEGYVITPKIVGEKVGLSPVMVIIVLLLGGEVAGLLGVLLAIPVAGALKVMLPDLIAIYHGSTYYTGVDVGALRMMGVEQEVEAEESEITSVAEPVVVVSAPVEPPPERDDADAAGLAADVAGADNEQE